MSERPTDTRPSHAAAAHGVGRDERARYAGAGPHGSSGHQSLADRAANFRQGAPFLVERATLYDPEPLDPPTPAVGVGGLPPRRLLPAALTLLGVVVVVGLAASVLFVRNADVVRHEEGRGRLEQFSDRALPPQGAGTQSNSGPIAYDLTRRPNDAIVGAWRPAAEDDARPKASETPPAASKRRPLPRRMSAAPSEVPPEAVTRPVAAASPRYDAPEPKRRVADSELPPGPQGQPPEEAATMPTPVSIPPKSSEPVPSEGTERPGPSVVARVGRASDPTELQEPQIEIPLHRLALPLRRPDPTMLEETEEPRPSSARARRARLLRLQRQLRREQRHARKREFEERQWIPEAFFGNRLIGMERLLP